MWNRFSCKPSNLAASSVFAKLKTLLRKAAERTVEDTRKRIGALLCKTSLHRNAPTISKTPDMASS
jgi:hypothetical protein